MEKMMSKHTPMTQNGTTVRFAGGGFDVRNCPDPEALAATIVRAVNSHGALVAALRDIAKDGEASAANGDAEGALCALGDIARAARAALAAAEA